jgi:hypothetical protein
MPKKRKTAASDDAEDPSKTPQNFRFTPETVRKLEEAARDYGMSKTAYTNNPDFTALASSSTTNWVSSVSWINGPNC